jgi:hypothetical protein
MSEESLGKSMQLVEWLARQVGGVRLDGEIRTRAAAICFGVAQEHHAAMVTLFILKTPLCSSAFALGRPLFEAYVRGMWLSHCATNVQIDGYLEGKIPDMASLIAALQKLQGDDEVSSLRRVYERSWRAMSGLTHTGTEHFDRWSDGEVLEPAFTSEDIGRILDFAARIGVLSAAGLAFLSRDGELWKSVLTGSRPLMPPRFDAPAAE